MRYTFLLLSDETREVLETILRFLLDVSVRLGNSQVSKKKVSIRYVILVLFVSCKDNLSKFGTYFSAISFSIFLWYTSCITKNSLVEMEKREI